MVGAAAVGLSGDWTLDKAVRLGIAAGTAMLRTPGTVLCRLSDLERFFDEAEHSVPAHTGPDMFDLVRKVRSAARQDRGKRRGESESADGPCRLVTKGPLSRCRTPGA